MRITIFNKQDKQAYTIPVNTESTYVWNLMQTEYISVKFQSNTILKLRKGYWCEIDGLGRFEIVDLPKPEASETADGWDYNLRMDRPWYRFKNRIYFYSRSQTNGMEVNWSLTDTIEQHAALLVRSINDIGFRYGSERYEVAIAQNISLEESRLVQFNKTSILDAITAIAEAFECEWWIDENTIHFGRCETGEAITLEAGKEIKRTLTRQDDSTEKHGTRLYAFGSSRNLNANYRRELNNPFHIGAVATIYEGKVRIATTKPSSWYSEEKKLTFTTGRYQGQTVPFEVVSGIYTANTWQDPVFEIDLGLLVGSNGYSGSDKIQFIIGSSDDEQTSQSTCQITSWTRESWQGFTFSDIEIPKMAITDKSRVATNGAQVPFEGMGILYDSDNNQILGGKDIYRRKDKGAVSTGSCTLHHIALAYINRIYTHPIDGDSDIAIQGIAQTTLKLPIGTPYIDSEPNLPEDDITEVVRQYEDIYPRCLLTITEVTEVDATDTDEDTGNVTHWKAYRFKATLQDGTAYNFDKGYIIPDESKPLSIHFESGRLNGMDFEVAFDPEASGDTRTFEIVRNETYTLQLPNETIRPEVGDTLYMYNMDVTFIDDTLIAAAENELKARAEEEMVELAKDDGTYTATTNPVLCESRKIDLAYGRMVTLVAPEYFQEKDNYSRTTRVIGWSKNLDDPYQAEYTIGEASAYSPYGALANDIEEVIYINTQNEIAKSAGGSGSKKTDKKISEKLSRVSDDTALGHITFNKGLTSREIAKLLKGAYFGAFAEGLRGGFIDGEGNAELNQLITRAKAILEELKVKGTAEFDGNLFSEEFVSGFLTGKGWGITKEKVKNALGVEETKYTGEFDNIIVRGALRVFTFVISQLLGENDNRIFTAMLEVDHYDAATGKVWFDTRGGKLYNPFRVGDYIMVQQYNGMPSPENQYYITKHYECIITGAGIGDMADGEKRLDWVTFKNFVTTNEDTPGNLITKGDTFVRVDNETDADRKGIIQVMTVGNATPYIDIAYGLKTDPDEALKGRIGSLKGIYSPLFGQLQGFGELLQNLYAVGDFRLRRTGESLDSKIEMLNGLFSTRYQKQAYEMTEEDNYLTNATFTENMDGWTKDSNENTKLLAYTDGEPVVLNGSVVSTGTRRANVEEYDGKQMLHIVDTGITQANALIRKPGTHKEYDAPASEKTTSEGKDVQDNLYLSIKLLPKTEGQLTIGFKYNGQTPEGKTNTLPYTQQMVIAKSKDWQTLQWEGTWHGLGDFRLQFTGEMYVSILAVTDKPLAEFKKTVSTQIIQTAENIRLIGQNIDATNQSVTNLGIELRAADREIRLYVDTETADLERRLGIVISDGDAAVKLYAEQYVKGQITENNKNYYTKSEIDVTVNGINTYVIGIRDDLTVKINGDIAALQTQIDAANTAIGKANDNTAALRTYVDGAFADGIIDEAEKVAIEKYLKTMASTKKDIDNAYTEIINNVYFDSSSSEYAALITAKRDVDNKYNALYTAISNAIVDGKATASEIAAVNTAFDNFNNAIGTFSKRVEEANEAIQNAIMKSANDAIAKNWQDTMTQIGIVNGEIADAKAATATLQNYVNGAFADGVLTDTEKAAMRTYLNQLDKEAEDMAKAYAQIHANTYLTGTPKTNLESAYSAMTTSLSSLKSVINGKLAKSKVTKADETDVDNAFDTYTSAIGTFSKRVEEANEAIRAALKQALQEYTDNKIAWVKEQAENLAKDAAKAETYRQASNPWNSWSKNTEKDHIGAMWTYTGSNNTVSVYDAFGNQFYVENGKTYRYSGIVHPDNNTEAASKRNVWEDMSKIAYAASYTIQKEDYISTVLANFNSDGSLSNAGGSVISAYGNKLWAKSQTVDTLSGRVSTAESKIDQQATQISLKVSQNGIISAINQSAETIQINASRIKLEGYTTINNSFSVDVDGTTTMGGFKVNGNGLTNIVSGTGNTNMAYIICRNDYYGRFAAIGANVLPATSGLSSAVGRFHNTDSHGWYSTNICLYLEAKNGERNYAFVGSGNGVLNGLVAGFKHCSMTTTKDKLTELPLKDGNIICFTCYADNSGLALPTIQNVRDALDINSSTYFSISLTFICTGSTRTARIYGKNSSVTNSSGVKWMNDSKYPQIWSNDKGTWDYLEMEQGDVIQFILVYDGSYGAYVASVKN